MARLAASQQPRDDRFIAYYSDDADDIEADIEQVDGWRRYAVGALKDGQLVGWLLGEIDEHIGRVWWWGPVVDRDDHWEQIAEHMYTAARSLLPAAIAQEEFAAGGGHQRLASLCARHGFVAGEASIALRCDAVPKTHSTPVGPCPPHHRDALAALHDHLFPNAHRSGVQLYEDPANHIVVAVVDDSIAAYAVGQLQSGDSGYVDFVGVDPRYRRRGLGQAVVAGMVASLASSGATWFHLTVRAGNEAARALYQRLGFREDRVLVPYRKNFALP